jgi:hypothetical protein
MKRRIGLVLAIAGLLFALLPVAPASASITVAPCGGGRYVTIYASANYSGGSKTLCASGGSWNSFLNLTPVPAQCTEDGSTYWNDCISSIIVGGSSSIAACFYRDTNYRQGIYGGYLRSTGTDWATLSQNIVPPGSGWNDEISSLKFTSGSC